jgi:paraquat-inducible protein A
MSVTVRTSLHSRFPRRLDIPVLLAASVGLLIAGLVLPTMHTEKLIFWEDTYSIIDGVIALFRESHFVLGALLFFFSMVFPVIKLVALGLLWFVPVRPETRGTALKWLLILGKWSMLDVFVVAVLIVITQLGGAIEAEARIGIYLFAAAIVGSLIASQSIQHLAKKVDGDAAP